MAPPEISALGKDAVAFVRDLTGKDSWVSRLKRKSSQNHPFCYSVLNLEFVCLGGYSRNFSIS